ncbi:uncharacterized protein CC84DRAFT_1169230 [Paraphaeosphaeria sporulosa]|uniref:F-box domain-containing protein n=1 Tax=Paraphaeosphaeria sporulosa TaxID=1460663 RepID=A0A177BYF5_9PLEO|nr:uncharacterized protein CC84DRAFT_1169230 [Paraphaeosphaeria sporulosa]OAF99718.1 hypothetical protein CC84DRAFT_1169230 [Paraphaeosphaeria sporulosa]
MQRKQVSRLESLPSELFLSIADYAGFDGRLSLSATNSSCRSLLLQIIFRTLKVTSDEKEASEILKLAKRIGVNVRAISFRGTAGPNPRKDESEDEQDGNDQDLDAVDASPNTPEAKTQEQILPQAAAALLSGEHLPNATHLIVNFAFDFENGHGSEGIWDSRDDLSDGVSMYVFTVPETSRAMIEESEAEFPWRRLMAQTWSAASQNANITSLVVPALVAKAVTPWFGPQWARFLAQIENADVRVAGADNGAGWEVGTLEGYMYFVSQLDSYFLVPMTNVKTLRLSCYEHGPLGSHWTDVRDTFALRPDCLPRLEELRLEYAVICSELVDFLVARGDTLRRVALHECFAERPHRMGEGDVRLTWAAFFSALRESGLQYQTFSVTNDAPPPLTFNEWQRSKHGDDDEYLGADGKPKDDEVDEGETEAVRSVRAELAREPGKRLFLYATLTDKYGDRWPDQEAIMEHFHAGRDMVGFEKLMRTVGNEASHG